MADLTESSKVATSCLLLDKLVPEVRLKIYEYVLTFDNPVKHTKNLQPFIEKITGFVPKSSGITKSRHQLNTSILSTNKIIYTEAIKIFYENNVIYFNVPKFEHKDLVSPQATDLSLATQVIMRIDTHGFSIARTPSWTCSSLNDAVVLAHTVFPAIFPNLRTSTVHIYTCGVVNLFGLASWLRRWSIFETVAFEAIGAVAATPKGRSEPKVSVHCKSTTESWNDQFDPHDSSPFRSLSARILQQKSRNESLSLKDREDAFKCARSLSDSYRARVVPDAYPIALDSHEFWTIVDEAFQPGDDDIPELTEGGP